MRVELQPGKYVVAVSGGVDSVVLLDVLSEHKDLELVVAHFDHGIRSDSAVDAQFVAKLADTYGLPFMTERAELGREASEATARQARYAFLNRVKQQHEAQAIITAHHQDDVLETAILNVLRGTGRRGLTSLKSTGQLVRPLLQTPKTDIIQYALKRKLSWREDTTNHDERYTRNYIRNRLLVRFDAGARQRLLALIEHQRQLNIEIDELLGELLKEQGGAIDRQLFAALPHDLAKEYMAAWLRRHKLADFDRPTLERLTIQAKTRLPGKQLDVMHGRRLGLTHKTIVLMT